MSNSVLIVERDLGLMSTLREALTGRGFQVEETTDGKGAPELIRRNKPACVVLAVDLDAGQNGYIICKKLKSDDELKNVKVIIVGNPDGFAQHKKLKTRADEYLGKPLDADQLVEGVGKLIGFPAAPAPAEETFDPSSLLDEVSGSSDPDLAAVDSAFEDPNSTEVSIDEVVDDLDAPERTVVSPLPLAAIRGAASGSQPPPFQSSGSSIDNPEARELRARVTELTGALDDAKNRQTELEAKVRELESQLESKSTELEAARASSGGKADSKEVFALKDAANKKDKEILKLKNELNAKETEILELKERENALEQQVSETKEELSQKDAQLKTLQQKADQLAAERKKVDQQLTQAKEEGRAASARLSTLEMDFEAAQQRIQALEGELETVKNAQQELESARQQVESELSEVRGELDAVKSQLDERTRELDEAKAAAETAQADLDSTRAQLTSQATTFADEISGLRQRLADTQGEARKAEEKASRAQQRLKAIQEQQERVRASLQAAVDTLSETPADGEDVDIDEIAEA
jgi:DNA-binding response OmpR family regulator/predicted  nucleic acid-binding Zn-ribbon protein